MVVHWNILTYQNLVITNLLYHQLFLFIHSFNFWILSIMCNGNRFPIGLRVCPRFSWLFLWLFLGYFHFVVVQCFIFDGGEFTELARRRWRCNFCSIQQMIAMRSSSFVAQRWRSNTFFVATKKIIPLLHYRHTLRLVPLIRLNHVLSTWSRSDGNEISCHDLNVQSSHRCLALQQRYWLLRPPDLMSFDLWSSNQRFVSTKHLWQHRHKVFRYRSDAR